MNPRASPTIWLGTLYGPHDLPATLQTWEHYLLVPISDWDPCLKWLDAQRPPARGWSVARRPTPCWRSSRTLEALLRWLHDVYWRLRPYLEARRLARGVAAAALAGVLSLSVPPALAAGGPFTEQTGAANPLNGVDVGELSAPAFVDIDNDGDYDAFIGEYFGTIKHYENIGTAANPTFVERIGIGNPLNAVDVGDYSVPTFVDIDNDGDYDAFIGEYEGTIKHYENIGSATNPVFVERTGAANPLNGVDVSYGSAPAFVDIDNDGDYDACIGEMNGFIKYYENTGTAANPTFVERTGNANPLNSLWVFAYSAPAFVDIDDDGDYDVFIGEMYGAIKHYENIGTASSSAFVERAGAANPLNVDVGYASRPAFVNIDADGDYDVFIGEGGGTIKYYRNDSYKLYLPLVLRRT